MRDLSVSVVLPTSNDAHRLERTLPAIAAALEDAATTVGDIELIIVDDASRDDSASVVTNHLPLFPHIRLIRLPWNCGRGTAVRAGVSAATGRTVTFIDDSHGVTAEQLTGVVALLSEVDVVLVRGPATSLGEISVVAPHVGRQLGIAAYHRLARRLTPTTMTMPGCRQHFAGIRGEVAKPVFSLLRARDFSFDVEARVVVSEMGLTVAELPSHRSATEAHPTPEYISPASSHLAVRSMISDLLRAHRHRARAISAGNRIPEEAPLTEPPRSGRDPRGEGQHCNDSVPTAFGLTHVDPASLRAGDVTPLFAGETSSTEQRAGW